MVKFRDLDTQQDVELLYSASLAAAADDYGLGEGVRSFQLSEQCNDLRDWYRHATMQDAGWAL